MDPFLSSLRASLPSPLSIFQIDTTSLSLSRGRIAPLFDEKSRSAGDLTTRGRATHSPPPPVGRNLIYFLLCGNVCGTEKGRGERRRERESRGFQSEKAFQSLEAKEVGQTRDLPRWTWMETRMESGGGQG